MDPMTMMMLMQAGHQFGNNASQFLSGMFNDSSKPYAEGMRNYDRYIQPWQNAGRNAIAPYTNRINQMGDTNGFYNSIMNNYQESPMARYQQQQGVRAGQNAASASGLTGSTPFAQQLQQNAQNISSQDMQRFFDNQMGINRDYLSGQNNLMNYGYGADSAAAPWMGEAGYGAEAGKQQDFSNEIGGFMHLLMG